MTQPSVLVLGASGYLGRLVVQELLRQRSKFARIAILTEESKRSKFDSVESQGIEIVLGSYLSPDSFKGFNTVYSLLGNHVMKDQPAIIDAAIAAGVSEFYPSEFGSDICKPPYLTNRYFRDKQLTRAHLEKAAAEHKGFGYTCVMVGGFIEFTVHPLFGFDVEGHAFTFYGSPDKQEVLTASPDVARYIVESTLLPRFEAGERAFRVPGGLYSWQQVVDAVSAAQGVEYTRTYLPLSEATDKAKECLERGDVDGELGYSLKALLGDPENKPLAKPWDNDKFSFEPENLSDALRRIFSEQASRT